MRIAYLVLAHKNPNQVKRLLNLLNKDVYVHIDKKCDIEKFYINKENIKYIDRRININWGGFTMVLATLELIYASNKDKDYDYYVLLSGDDYPIKNLNEFELFLNNNKEYSFMEYDKFEEKFKWLKYRYQQYRISERKHVIYKIVQKILKYFMKNRDMYANMEAYKGSQWWCLKRECIDYILEYIKDNEDILKYFKHTTIPDEMFFQTILINSPIMRNIRNDNLRYIILQGSHPEILTSNSLNDFISSKNKFFARKFDINIDSDILDFLDNRYSLKDRIILK